MDYLNVCYLHTSDEELKFEWIRWNENQINMKYDHVFTCIIEVQELDSELDSESAHNQVFKSKS